MLNTVSKTKNISLTGLQILIVTLLVLGIFFRFANIDQKVYWLDETHTSLRIFGYTEPEFMAQVFTGEPVNVDNLLVFQQPSPEKDLTDTVSVLAGNTEHTPLYYLMASVWGRWLGGAVGTIRSLSALLSLLALPCMYWLCQELFGSALVGWLAVALVAVSPLQALFAQEARPYSLLTVTILLSSAALLRAMRKQTKLSWGLYAVSVALGLYSHWFFALVAVGHGLYVLVTERFRPTKTAIAYVITSLIGLITFSPWILLILTSPPPLEQQMGWVFQKLTLKELAHAWVLNISRIFFDLDRGFCLPAGSDSCRYFLGLDDPLTYLFFIPIVGLVAYSIYFLCRKTPQRVWLFVVILIGVTAMALLLPDLLKGGQRSTVTRYLVASTLGVQLAVAYGLATHLGTFTGKVWWQQIWRGVAIALISVSILSCVVISEAKAWWSKGGNYHIAPIVQTINAADQPLVIYSVPSNVVWGKGGAVGRVVPLFRNVERDTKLLFVIQPEVLETIPAGFKDVFVYRPHEELKTWLAQNYELQPVGLDHSNETPRLWKLGRSQSK